MLVLTETMANEVKIKKTDGVLLNFAESSKDNNEVEEDDRYLYQM